MSQPHMLKTNPIIDKLFWKMYRMFVSWLGNRCHFVGMVIGVIPISVVPSSRRRQLNSEKMEDGKEHISTVVTVFKMK